MQCLLHSTVIITQSFSRVLQIRSPATQPSQNRQPRPRCPTNIGTIRTLTLVRNERLPREVILFLDLKTLACAVMACRHFEVVIRNFANAALQVRRRITHGYWNAAARHKTICNTCHSHIGRGAPLHCQDGQGGRSGWLGGNAWHCHGMDHTLKSCSQHFLSYVALSLRGIYGTLCSGISD